ncbi:glycosyltransferase family 2 protein [Inquilinus sp. KBS0705]|nr:glycosyltransferase family 2 protein [Inquilinus sp. KBS0705]
MASTLIKNIAVLACSYNRLHKTTAFLESLTRQYIPDGYALSVYLLDDQSTDGTADYVKANFPGVHLIEGSGSLFWAGGMHLLWKTVIAESEHYDFYLLMNDDVKLYNNAIANLLDSYQLSKNPENIIVGSVQHPETLEHTYGGRKLVSKYSVIANPVVPGVNELKECEMGNANIMLVDKATVDKIGILSDQYIHSFADYDYTLNAVRQGIKVWVAPGYYGSCENDHGHPWLTGATLRQRIKFLYSPKGLEYKSFLRYSWKNFPINMPAEIFKMWLKTLLPIVYDKFKKP